MPHVLIVDDAEDIVELASIGLDIAGWTSASAGHSQAALEALGQGSFDLVLLDYQLGTESGLELLPQLLRLTSAPVVFLTAAQSEHERRQFLEAGARGVVAKPFDPMLLGETLQAFL
jgi:DNA-binding response OmpR family regulator